MKITHIVKVYFFLYTKGYTVYQRGKNIKKFKYLSIFDGHPYLTNESVWSHKGLTQLNNDIKRCL